MLVLNLSMLVVTCKSLSSLFSFFSQPEASYAAVSPLANVRIGTLTDACVHALRDPCNFVAN